MARSDRSGNGSLPQAVATRLLRGKKVQGETIDASI
jgi:hypothetical protein